MPRPRLVLSIRYGKKTLEKQWQTCEKRPSLERITRARNAAGSAEVDLNNSQRLRHFRQYVRRPEQVRVLMRGAHYRTQPRLAFRHRRIGHCRREDSRVEQFPRKFIRLRPIAPINRHTRRTALIDI